MPRYIIKDPEPTNTKDFNIYWKKEVTDKNNERITTQIINNAHNILFGVMPSDNCSSCFRARLDRLLGYVLEHVEEINVLEHVEEINVIEHEEEINVLEYEEPEEDEHAGHDH